MNDTVAGSLRSRRWADTPSMKRHGHPFSVTVDALIGARFHPTLDCYRHNDSHFLRALWTKQRSGVSKDCLVRHMLLQRHDGLPPAGKATPIRLGPMAESRLYKTAQLQFRNTTRP